MIYGIAASPGPYIVRDVHELWQCGLCFTIKEFECIECNGAGDMPVVLMFDGPSLGGFVCPATITSSQIWKMGQVSANDTIRFKRLTLGKSPSCLCIGSSPKRQSNLFIATTQTYS